jgi:hypothetical protein
LQVYEVVTFRLQQVIYDIWLLLAVTNLGAFELTAKISNAVILHPLVPNSDQGQVLSFSSKGRIVYIAQQQHYLDVLNDVEVSLSVSLVVMLNCMKWFGKEPPKMKFK